MRKKPNQKKSPVGEYLLFKLWAGTSREKVLKCKFTFFPQNHADLKTFSTSQTINISPFDSPNGGHLKPKKVPLKGPNKVTTWQVLYV